MSINTGKIRITEEINWHNKTLIFFKLKQNKNHYYCTSIQLLDEREGYLIFPLVDNLDILFKKNDYSEKVMKEMFKDHINEFYFVSFQDEDPNSEYIEYCGKISKEDVFKLYEVG